MWPMCVSPVSNLRHRRHFTDVILGLCCLLLHVLFIGNCYVDGICDIPEHFQGEYYSLDVGSELNTMITNSTLSNEQITASCHSYQIINGSMDGQGRFDVRMLFHNRMSSCYQCYEIYHRTVNVLQLRHSVCITDAAKATVNHVCGLISPAIDLLTMFRINLRTVNCKSSIEGTYHFTYEVDYGGGGICNSPDSSIVACQLPGSIYVDNQVFEMNFGVCDEVETTFQRSIKFLCMGMWIDTIGNMYIAVADIGREKYRERFRCLLTRHDQQVEDNYERYAMSRWASCASVKSPYDGPIRLALTPAVYALPQIQPSCLFPRNFSGVWTKGGDYDSAVTINNTHIHFQTTQGQYWYRETVWSCQQNRDTRYLTTVINIGKCEVDYVCWDIMPRHQNILRWRLARSFPVEEAALRPDKEEYAFRRGCSWSMFTHDRDNADWMYSTFILNPPVPIICPIGGRYTFQQYGRPEELYWTRIRGVTERPRHQIDCTEWISVIKSCNENPRSLVIDAEYCATLDHTGKPIGEYDTEIDREMYCVGYWMEDMKSYMVTYDLEDPFSPFRCWVYNRMDWRHVIMSKTSTPWCGSDQTALTYDPLLFGAVHLDLRESERLWDSCPQRYDTGANPYEKMSKIYVLEGKGSAVRNGRPLSTSVLSCASLLIVFVTWMT